MSLAVFHDYPVEGAILSGTCLTYKDCCQSWSQSITDNVEFSLSQAVELPVPDWGVWAIRPGSWAQNQKLFLFLSFSVSLPSPPLTFVFSALTTNTLQIRTANFTGTFCTEHIVDQRPSRCSTSTSARTPPVKSLTCHTTLSSSLDNADFCKSILSSSKVVSFTTADTIDEFLHWLDQLLQDVHERDHRDGFQGNDDHHNVAVYSSHSYNF